MTTGSARRRALEDVPRRDVYGAVGSAVYHRLVAADRSARSTCGISLRASRGPVLELACGSGRLTLPLLAAGATVTGIDLSPEMIALLRQALRESPKLRGRADRLTTLVGDMAAFDLAGRFGLVVLGTTSVTLIDAPQRAACFRRVRAHLAAGGRFLVSTVDFPDRGGPFEIASALGGHPGATLHEYVDPAAGRRWTTIVVEDERGAREAFCSAPALLPSGALTAELESAGLEVVRRDAVPGADRTLVVLECVARGAA